MGQMYYLYLRTNEFKTLRSTIQFKHIQTDFTLGKTKALCPLSDVPVTVCWILIWNISNFWDKHCWVSF